MPSLTLDQVFNLFCKIVEREIPDERIWNALKVAPICAFDPAAHERATEATGQADARDLYLPPMMPFDEFITLDEFGLTLFYDAKDYEPGEFMTPGRRPSNVQLREGEESSASHSVLRDVAFVTFIFGIYADTEPPWWAVADGRVWLTEGGNNRVRGLAMWDERVTIRHGVGADSRPRWTTKLANAPRFEDFDWGTRLTQMLTHSLDQLFYIDLPKHHVIVERPANLQQRVDGPKQPRMHDREKVRLIEPEAVRTIYSRPADAEVMAALGRSVTPHARRGYTKYLTSSKFVKKQWTRIRIRPTWVGDYEWQSGPLKYRVLVRGNDATGRVD